MKNEYKINYNLYPLTHDALHVMCTRKKVAVAAELLHRAMHVSLQDGLYPLEIQTRQLWNLAHKGRNNMCSEHRLIGL
jgi:hypothetical protein